MRTTPASPLPTTHPHTYLPISHPCRHPSCDGCGGWPRGTCAPPWPPPTCHTSTHLPTYRQPPSHRPNCPPYDGRSSGHAPHRPVLPPTYHLSTHLPTYQPRPKPPSPPPIPRVRRNQQQQLVVADTRPPSSPPPIAHPNYLPTYPLPTSDSLSSRWPQWKRPRHPGPAAPHRCPLQQLAPGTLSRALGRGRGGGGQREERWSRAMI